MGRCVSLQVVVKLYDKLERAGQGRPARNYIYE